MVDPRENVINKGESGHDSRETKEEESRKGVSFGEVRVREHERVLDRRPSSLYAGLELGWGHREDSLHILVDDFEKKKEEEHHDNHKYRQFERIQALAKYGYSVKDVTGLEEKKKHALELREKGVVVPEEVEGALETHTHSKKHGIKHTFNGLFHARSHDKDSDEATA